MLNFAEFQDLAALIIKQDPNLEHDSVSIDNFRLDSHWYNVLNRCADIDADVQVCGLVLRVRKEPPAYGVGDPYLEVFHIEYRPA